MKRILTLTILVIVAKHSLSQQTKTASEKYLDTFYVFVENGKNVITWISKTEKNVSWYRLERSVDGKEYFSARLYDSGDLHKRAYQFKDSRNPETIRSYRIQILDSKNNILDTQYIYIKQTKKEDLPIELYAKTPYKIRGFYCPGNVLFLKSSKLGIMQTVMKKTSIYMAILLVLLVPSLSFAQNAAVFGTKDEVKAGETTTTPAELKDSPLSAKKLYVETQLKNLLAQLSTISTRTQAAVDRLSDKNIDTTAAQAQLDKAGVALTNAKISIDAFSAIQVTDTADKAKTAALTASLKEAVKKAEDNLKISRDALIQSLSLLKTSINASISSETE